MTPTTIHPNLRRMDFDALAAAIVATGDPDGAALVTAQREYISRAKCSACARAASAARLRVWLTRHQDAEKGGAA